MIAVSKGNFTTRSTQLNESSGAAKTKGSGASKGARRMMELNMKMARAGKWNATSVTVKRA